MARIGLILPYKELYNEITYEIKNDDDLEIRIASLEKAEIVARELINRGIEILVCRGGTADYLKKEFKNISIIDIEVSSYDIAKAIKTAKLVDNNLAFIIFSIMVDVNKDLRDLFEFNINIYYVDNIKETEIMINKAISEGYTTFAGGNTVGRLCKEKGLNSILIKSGIESVSTAIRQAKNILKVKDENLRNFNLIKDVIQNTLVGIIAINKENKIKLANNAAVEILSKSDEQIIGNNLYIMLGIDKNIKDGNFAVDYDGNHLVLNKKSRHVHSLDIISVFTIEKVSDINEKEKNLRRLYVKKGYFARFKFEDINGSSKIIQNTIDLSKKYAKSDSTILLVGETGTGKEMFAQSIHNYSLRKDGPFVAVNCAALTETLLESELFGYVKGAFTGASKEGKEGIFEMANGGTIFLDEISEVSLTTQSKLLRVIQERKVMRIGGADIKSVDVRIIAATNKNLLELIERGDFRNDLYYRLSVLKVSLPPLRNRKEDIKILLDNFLNFFQVKMGKDKPIISNECKKFLESYNWPGNIRELKNFAERLMVAYDKKIITSEIIKQTLDIEENSRSKDLNIKNVLKILKQNENNKTKTAKELGISRTTLWKMLKEIE